MSGKRKRERGQQLSKKPRKEEREGPPIRQQEKARKQRQALPPSKQLKKKKAKKVSANKPAGRKNGADGDSADQDDEDVIYGQEGLGRKETAAITEQLKGIIENFN